MMPKRNIIVTLGILLLQSTLTGMEKNHLEKLKEQYLRIENNSVKLNDMLNHIGIYKKRHGADNDLEEFEKMVLDHTTFVQAYKEFNKIYKSSFLDIHNEKIKYNKLQQTINLISESKALDEKEKNKIRIAQQYLAIQIHTMNLFANPKSMHNYIPCEEKEKINEFLPFDGTAHDQKGNNLLHWAIHNNATFYALSYLLECGISCNEQNKNGETVLHKAVERSSSYVYFFLHERIKTHPLTCAFLIFPSLKKISKKAHVDYVQKISEQYVTQETINKQDKDEQTALYKACVKKCVASVELLLKVGADPEIKNKEKKTCLESLCAQPWDEQSTQIATYIFIYHPELEKQYAKLYKVIMLFQQEKYNLEQATSTIKEILLEERIFAQKSIQNSHISLNIKRKKVKKEKKSVQLLEQPPKTKVTCTYKASSIKDHEIFQKIRNISMLEKYLKKKKHQGINLNIQNQQGFTLLKQAIDKKNIEVARFLLQRGADANIPYHTHMRQEDKEQVHCLRLMPLELVTTLGDTHIMFNFIKLLTEYGADFEKVKYLMPLQKMVLAEDMEGVKFVVQQKNVDINSIDFFNSTPLLAACEKMNLSIIRLLLQHKANPNMAVENIYPLDIAYDKKSFDIVRELVGGGATKGNVYVTLNGKEIALEEKQDKIKKVLSNHYVIGFEPNKIISIKNNPASFFWYILRHGTALDLLFFLEDKNNQMHIDDYKKSHEKYGFPFDYAMNEKGFTKEKNGQKLLLLLMYEIADRSDDLKVIDDVSSIILNHEYKKLSDPLVQEKICKGLKQFKENFPVYVAKNNKLNVLTSPDKILWTLLLDNTASDDIEIIFNRFENKEVFDREYAQLGYPLDYALNNNKEEIINFLLRHNIHRTCQYEISQDIVTQKCLKHLEKTDVVIKICKRDNKLPLLILEPK